MTIFEIMNKAVIDFLEKNGFKCIEKDSYTNSKCTVSCHDDGYIIENENGAMYSSDLNIYWLIGFLTYYNFIKNIN